MTIVHKAGKIHKNAYGLIRLALPNTPDNPAYVPTGAGPQIPIEVITSKMLEKNSLKKLEIAISWIRIVISLLLYLTKIAKMQIRLVLWMIFGKNLITMEDSIYLMVYYIIDLKTHVLWACVVEC
ncbi:hypothetical protein O181_089709 [Austropuccinia psidii MF-1]|uniref:Uncharacterized protein n=1 Tax=Austropuccinia psidii MF-1 TaxID=1389203 RepID=A0A9Q3P5Z7_9BASI|nr:hypothetical protein [Austropuccinia psidii MF-1]